MRLSAARVVCRLSTIASVMLWLAAIASAATLEISEPFVGVRHVHRTTTAPRQLDMHLLEIDLTAPGLSFLVTPPNYADPGETTAQTPRGFLTQQNAQIAINGAYSWYVQGPYMDIEGLAVSNGVVYSSFQEHRLEALNISQDNVATIIKSLYGAGIAHTPTTQLYNVVGGDARLVTAGVNTANPNDNNLHPRTAAGVTAQGKLLLLTVDGRNPSHSRGVSTPELANLLIEFGAHDAINLDGGGSTTMVFADPAPRVVNIPVGINNVPGTERAVGNNLAIFALANPGHTSTMIYADFEHGDETTLGQSLTYSGSTGGILAASAAAAVAGEGRNGSWGQRLTILDDPGVQSDDENSAGWFIRHVSGKSGVGSPANRSSNAPRPTVGAVGFWARTFNPGIDVSLALDNSSNVTADRSVRLPLIPDGQWRRYAWDLQDPAQWEGWFNGDGLIDTPDFTIDSIQLFGPNANATVWIDDVFHDAAPVAAADFDVDGRVDAADLARWKAADLLSATADANNDGYSDGADFLAWQRGLNAPIPTLAAGLPVPEPGASITWALAALAAAVRRRIGRGHQRRDRPFAPVLPRDPGTLE